MDIKKASDFSEAFRVGDGARTRDPQNHNLVL